MTTLTVLDPIIDDLRRVEAKLRETPQLKEIEFDLVSKAIDHLFSSGGKRIRPSLALLTGRLY
ncbi:MAG TPA: heptaprenyl diphosphate synthase, partial [Anaerolineae bacterium]|nr:heptaprenyl diphosphate synthase [Anaerolineae bacterium]